MKLYQGKKPENKIKEIEVRKEFERRLRDVKKYMRKDILEKDYLNEYWKYSMKIGSILGREPIFIFDQNFLKIITMLKAMKTLKIQKKVFISRLPYKRYKRIKNISNEIELTFYDIFDREKMKNPEVREKIEFSRDDLILEIQKYILVYLVTSLETYLEHRLQSALFFSEKLYNEFIKKMDDDLPTKWRKNGKIHLSEYYFRMKEIIFDNLLLFPYHQIDNRTNDVYKAAFELDLMTFTQIGEIMRLVDLRHKLVHKGGMMFIEEELDIDEKYLRKYIRVVYNFVSWIEQNLEKFKLHEAFDDFQKKYGMNLNIPNYQDLL